MVAMTARIEEKLQAAVDAGAVPGVVAMAAGPDGVLYEGAAGKRSAAADDPITPDTMLRIASMTKMVTTTAALQLIERGSLSLDAPVSEYRSEFACCSTPSSSRACERRAPVPGPACSTPTSGWTRPAESSARSTPRPCPLPSHPPS